MIAVLLGGLIAGLIALYIINPPVRRTRLSVSRFLSAIPPSPTKGRLRPGRLLVAPLFWLQLLVLTALWLASWVESSPWTRLGPRNIGLLLVLDTSASMTTQQGEETRMQAAQRTASDLIARSILATEGGGWCARISTFDLAWHELSVVQSPESALAAIAGVVARPVGTDLDQVHRKLRELAQPRDPAQPPADCPTTDIVVITDRPTPAWVDPSTTKWQDIHQPVTNVGFTAIEPIRNLLTGQVLELQYEITAFGTPTAATTLTIRGPADFVYEETITWGEQRVFQNRLVPPQPGKYSFNLSADGVYTYDDTAELKIGAPDPIRLDWQHRDRSAMERLGWQQSTDNPLVRVIDFEQLDSTDTTSPTLVLGPGYTAASPQLIGDFDESSPIIVDLNLDVAEEAGMVGIPQPQGFAPVLTDAAGKVWIATRQQPPAVYLPGPPRWDDDDISAFSQTAFFNALRLLLDRRDLPAVYTLTTDRSPQPRENQIALHPGEGDTSGTAQSVGDLDEWATTADRDNRAQWWPILIAFAAAVLLLERIAAIWRGHQWS